MTAAPSVPGLRLIPTYLAASERDELLAIIDAQPWLGDLKRRVQHYGFRYDYKHRRVDPSMYLGPLPDWAQALAERMHRDRLIGETPDQLIVNEYLAGQGISPHVDCIPCFGDTILSLSLGSPCVMIFTSLATRVQAPILLEPGSLVVMQGESRTGWKHGIPARKSDTLDGRTLQRSRRVSLTFRKVNKPAQL